MDTHHRGKGLKEHSYSDIGVLAYLGGGPALDTQVKTQQRAPPSLHLPKDSRKPHTQLQSSSFMPVKLKGWE